MRALIVGAVGVLGVLCLSNAAMAQSRNRVDIVIHNQANHAIGLHDVSSMPQAKNWTWRPDSVNPKGTGYFSAYWADNQGQRVTVEVEGMTPGPYGCLVKCSVQVDVSLYDATSTGFQCSDKKPTAIYKTTSNNNVCGNVTCRDNGGFTPDKSTCSWTLDMDFTDPDHY